MPRRVALTLALAATPLVLLASQPQFWRVEGAKEFLEGTLEGLSVDSDGSVRISPASKMLFDPESPDVWCLARDPKGAVYAGTGNEGKVFRIESGLSKLFFTAAELEIHAIAAGPDGRIYVGSSPDGKVYAVDEKGTATPFFEPSAKYIWALAFDKAGNLYVATGSEGKIFKVDKKGQGSVVFTSPDTHVISLATDAKGNLYAGSSPGGVIYRLDAAMKVSVLYDSPYREVKAIEVSPDGKVYAAVIESKDEAPRPPAVLPTPPPAATPAAAGVAEVTVQETFAILPSAAAPLGRPAEAKAAAGGKGAILELLPGGEIETLWSSGEDTPQAMLGTENGVLVGTGDKGKLFRIQDDRTWTMVASYPADHVTSLLRGPGGSIFLGTSNAGKIFSIEGRPGTLGTFTSKVKDTETVSSFGRLRWDATTPLGTTVEIATRSGNTASPDSTWSDWSSPYTRRDGDSITTERARFLQVRAVLKGKDGQTPVLEQVQAAYLQRNLRPVVTSVTVHPPGEVFQRLPGITGGEVEILGLETPDPPEPHTAQGRPGAASTLSAMSRKLYQKGLQTFSWKAEDPNGDTLVYDVYIRLASERRFRLLRKGLQDAVMAWDTSTVPDGRYVVKVVARDTPSNPEPLALSGEKESVPFDVDTTPPVVTATLDPGRPPRVRARAKDDSSIIRRAEYSLDGGRWREVHPAEGISDSMEETYEIVLEDLQGPGPHIVVVRAQDLLGNTASAKVEVP